MRKMLLFLLSLVGLIYAQLPAGNVKGVGYLEIYKGGKVQVYRILEVFPKDEKVDSYGDVADSILTFGGLRVFVKLVEEREAPRAYRENTILKAEFQNLQLGTIIYALARLTDKNVIFGKELFRSRSLVEEKKEKEAYQKGGGENVKVAFSFDGQKVEKEVVELPNYLTYNVSFIIRKPVSAYELFNTLLREYNLVAVKVSRNLIKIGLRDTVTIDVGQVPEKVVKELLNHVKRYLSPAAKVVYDRQLGTLIITDLKENVDRLRALRGDLKRAVSEKVREFEEKKKSKVSRESPLFISRVFYFKNEVALEQAEKILEEAFGSRLTITPDYEFNALTLYGPANLVKSAESKLRGLVSETSEPFVTSRVFYVRYISPYELKKKIEPLLSEEGEVYVLTTEPPQEEGQKKEIKEEAVFKGVEDLSEELLGDYEKERRGSLYLKSALLIKDYPERIEEVYRKFKKFLSEKPIKIRIRAKFVEVQKSLLRELGISWNAVFSKDKVSNFWGGSVSFNANNDNAGLLTFTLSNAKLNSLELWLRAYERENKARSLAEPYIDTLNGEPALIASGLEWPITRLTYSQTTTNVTWQYKTIPLILQATPLVLPDGNVLLDVTLARKQIVEVMRVPITQDLTQDIPIISASRIEIKIPVKEGETVVIGGIVERNTSKGEEGVPGLRRIPLLGWLFKSEVKELRDRELLIFLTPQVVEE